MSERQRELIGAAGAASPASSREGRHADAEQPHGPRRRVGAQELDGDAA